MKKKKVLHRRKSVTPNKNHHSSLFTFGSVVTISIAVFIFFFTQSTPPLRPLRTLRVPEEPTIILAGPHWSETVNTSVLGAETIDSRDIVTYVNEERMKRGIRPLRVSDTLVKAAEMRVKVIMKYQNFSHHDPYEGIQLDTVLPLLQYPYSWASENIGMGDTTGRAFVTGFMNSPSHRDNLLNPALVETGVAVASGPYKQYYVNVAVQLFAVPTDPSTYLGYTEKDVQEYKTLMEEIGKQLEKSNALKEKDPENADYYEEWQQLLIRQQEIIATLSHTMHEQDPFAREMIALIKEYNGNWASVPVKN